MRKFFYSLPLLFFIILINNNSASAIGFEAAIGYWIQNPSGNIKYETVSQANSLDLQDDMNYDREGNIIARLKIDMPLILPNIYLMATPMKFDATNTVDEKFTFGDKNFEKDKSFNSETKIDQYDITLFYSIPFLKTATLGKLNAEIGLNGRIIDFKTEINQENTSESFSKTYLLPTIYIGIQLMPLDYIAIDIEGRGIAYSSNHIYDLIGRIRLYPIDLFFIALGYRYEDVKIEEDGLNTSMKFQGPFIEGGLTF